MKKVVVIQSIPLELVGDMYHLVEVDVPILCT